MGPNLQVLDARRALEALRNGVPNRDAVQALGSNQKAVEQKFTEVLDGLKAGIARDGILLSGGFGSGKSHLLEHLEHQALLANCVCSRIVVSKETPLFDLGKVFKAAADQAVVPGRTGQAIQEIAHMLQPRSDRYAEFYRWATSKGGGLPDVFPASLFVHERLGNDPELVEEMTAFWAGDRIAVSRVKEGLKKLGATKLFDVRPVKVRDLGAPRFAFASQLIRAAGFAGWVLLIDEVELIGRYSRLQRARSYAEVSRWLGAGEGRPQGVGVVMAITDDFTLAVLQQKSDRDLIGETLQRKGTAEYQAMVPLAERGMKLIEGHAVPLTTPDSAVLASTHDGLRAIHAKAFDWMPPELAAGPQSLQRPMRSYVRRWINEWDLRRLYPEAKVDIVEGDIGVSYEEDQDLEVSPDETEG